MSKPQPAQLVREKPRKARAIIIFDDTEGDAPRTWTVALGNVLVSDVELITVDRECNAGSAKSYIMRHVDEMDLLGSTRPWP